MFCHFTDAQTGIKHEKIQCCVHQSSVCMCGDERDVVQDLGKNMFGDRQKLWGVYV